jgi:hypothetical protein
MLPTERLAYSPITKRKPLKLANGARMVVWTITNVEEWDATQPMPRTVLSPPAGGSPNPDIPNWCWHEYGNRVGFWRLLKVYDEFQIPGVMNINGIALAAYPELAQAAVERQWEFVGHGFTQRNMQRSQTSARTSARPLRPSRRPPASGRAAGSVPASPKDFAPITEIAVVENVLVISSRSPIHTLEELIALGADQTQPS